MDMVWLDTMFPGIDEDSGWKENLERVVNYDYLLKEYLDWQLKHLSTDNFNPTDWSNIQEEIISMTAGQIDLTAYYTKDEADELYASLQLYADEQLASLSLAADSTGGTAQLVLRSGGTTIPGSGASLGLSVTNNSNGYSYVKLTSGGVDLATSGNITLGGNVVFASGSGDTKNLSYTTISGGTVTTNTITALNITANNIVANASISSPAISGGTITGNTISSSTISGGLIVGSTFYSADKDSYFLVGANGWSLYQKSGSSWSERSALQASSTSMKIVLGSDNPKAVFEKYYVNSEQKHYLWLGDLNRNHGLLINLSTGAYSFS